MALMNSMLNIRFGLLEREKKILLTSPLETLGTRDTEKDRVPEKFFNKKGHLVIPEGHTVHVNNIRDVVVLGPDDSKLCGQVYTASVQALNNATGTVLDTPA